MQKLLRLRHFIHDAHLLAHHDSFPKKKEEARPSVRSPVGESIPQRTHKPPSMPSTLSRSSSFPAQSTPPHSEEPLPRASTFDILLARRPQPRSPSPQPNQKLTSSSKREHEAQTVDHSDDTSSNGGASVGSTANSVGHTRPKTVWSVDDSYLPRAKPPPPLKPIRHRRNRSETSAMPSETSGRSSTFSRASSRPASKMEIHSEASCPLRSTDTPVLDISPKNSHYPEADVQPPTTRLSTQMSMSDSSSITGDITFAPCECRMSGRWTPPPRRAGASRAVSTKENDGSKGGGYIATSSSKSGCRPTKVPSRVNSTRSLRKARPAHLLDAGGPKRNASAVREESLSSGVAVSIQCYEHNEWQEKPMADVIPKLRVLKLK